jgi:thiol:disulfide interchange protein
MSALQQAKTFLVENLHLAKDALHIYVALIVFFGACLLFGWKARDWKPLAAVLLVALLGEAWDIRDRFVQDIRADYPAHIKDLWNTLLAPTAILLLARFSKVFGGRMPGR